MIRLREIRRGDMELLHKWINDPEVIRFTNSYRPISELEQNYWMDNLQYFRNNYVFGIERCSDNVLIGTCGLYDIDNVSRKAELRLKICNSNERGKGYGEESLRQLIAFGFTNANLNKIWLRVFSSNSPAVNLYLKTGFIKEGTLRDEFFIQGKYIDGYVMGMLRSESPYKL